VKHCFVVEGLPGRVLDITDLLIQRTVWRQHCLLCLHFLFSKLRSRDRPKTDFPFTAENETGVENGSSFSAVNENENLLLFSAENETETVILSKVTF